MLREHFFPHPADAAPVQLTARLAADTRTAIDAGNLPLARALARALGVALQDGAPKPPRLPPPPRGVPANVAAFLAEQTRPTEPDEQGTGGEFLHNTYKAWASIGGRWPLSKQRFASAMAALGKPAKHTSTVRRYPVVLIVPANRPSFDRPPS